MYVLNATHWEIIQICRHVTLLINKSELENVPDGPKVGKTFYIEEIDSIS